MVSATDLGPHDPTVEHADAVSQGNGKRDADQAKSEFVCSPRSLGAKRASDGPAAENNLDEPSRCDLGR